MTESLALLIRKDKLIVLAAFLLAIAAVAGFHLFGNGATPQPPVGPPLRPSAVGEFRGVALQLHSGDPNHPYDQYVDEIATTGANTVMLVLAAYQENASSTSISIDARKVPTEARIRLLIAHAHRKGLRVVLMPVVLLENPRDKEWRGKIAPKNWASWWRDYRHIILSYARLAQETGVEVFMVGSELVSTERTHAEKWRALIASVRKAYSGRISYSANWDHYRPITWWNELDMIGMTTYYDLTGGEPATVPRLTEAWESIKDDILAWRKKYNRPILFTEVGWPNQVTCAQYPWDYYRSTDKPDPQAQANCFEAFFRTWIREKAVAGFIVWEWRNYPGQNTDPQKDTSYVPHGKPALDVIRKYYRYPSPNAATRPATRPAFPNRPRPRSRPSSE